MHSRGTGNVPIRSDPIRVPNNNNNGRNGAEEDSGIIIVLFTLIAFVRVPRWYRMLSVISQWLLVLHRNIDTCLGHCYSSHGLSHPIMILFRFTRVNKLALNFIDNSLYRLIALILQPVSDSIILGFKIHLHSWLSYILLLSWFTHLHTEMV